MDSPAQIATPVTLSSKIIAEASSRNQLTSEVEGLPQEQLLVETEDFLVGYANHTQVDELMHEIGRLREVASSCWRRIRKIFGFRCL